MKSFKDIDLDDLKVGINEQYANFMDQQYANMLSFVKQYESENDFWFVNYYAAQSFTIFVLGGMAANLNEKLWINPEEAKKYPLKDEIMNIIKMQANKDIWEIFNGREYLTYKLFAYGTHQVQSEAKEEQERAAKKTSWSYSVMVFTKEKEPLELKCIDIIESKELADRRYEMLSKGKELIVIEFQISPYMKGLLEARPKADSIYETIIKNIEHIEIVRYTDNAKSLF